MLFQNNVLYYVVLEVFIIVALFHTSETLLWVLSTHLKTNPFLSFIILKVVVRLPKKKPF